MRAFTGEGRPTSKPLHGTRYAADTCAGALDPAVAATVAKAAAQQQGSVQASTVPAVATAQDAAPKLAAVMGAPAAAAAAASEAAAAAAASKAAAATLASNAAVAAVASKAAAVTISQVRCSGLRISRQLCVCPSLMLAS